MKKNIIKRPALMLALVISLCAVLGSCGAEPIASTAQESAVVGKVGNYEIRYEELRYLVLNHKKDMEVKYGEGIWSDQAKAKEYEEELWELVNDSIVSDYYAVLHMADDYYLGKSETMMNEPEILDAVQENVELVVDECGSFRKYKKALAEQFMTDRLFRFYLAAEECATELFYIMVQDLGVIESDEDYINDYLNSESFIRTNHIFLKGVTEENRALAHQLRDQLLAAENTELELIMLKGVHCADYSMTTKHGKYFALFTSDYGEEYEDAAFDLYEGELSEVVETPDGFYIILRLEKEDDYIKENYDTFKDDILGSEFNKLLMEYKDELTFELNDYGKTINISEIE